MPFKSKAQRRKFAELLVKRVKAAKTRASGRRTKSKGLTAKSKARSKRPSKKR